MVGHLKTPLDVMGAGYKLDNCYKRIIWTSSVSSTYFCGHRLPTVRFIKCGNTSRTVLWLRPGCWAAVSLIHSDGVLPVTTSIHLSHCK